MKSAEMELLAMEVARETGDRFAEALGLDCMGQVAIYRVNWIRLSARSRTRFVFSANLDCA